MIDLFFSPTPNGLKVRLFLEEAGVAYRLITVRLSAGEQFLPGFTTISPNNRIPAIVDHDPVDRHGALRLFESGAILLYLAEKIGCFIPSDPRGRVDVLQWLFWQMAGLGPMAGQAGYFRVYAPDAIPFAIDRYTKETHRLYGVLDRRLAGREYIADRYSIADMACYPWIIPHRAHGLNLEEFPNLQRWFHALGKRTAVMRVYDGVEDVYAVPGDAIPDALNDKNEHATGDQAVNAK